jgi:outer membrane protein
MPLNSSSSISVIGGKVETSNTPAPEVDFSYFVTDNVALELIAATTKHDLYAVNSALGGRTKVGSTWVLPPTLLLQYHFMPKERFSPYVGAGLNLSFFYGTQAATGINQLAMKSNVGAAIQAGFDYNVSGHWFANFDVKQIFVNTTASVNGGAIQAKTALNPLVIGAGIGYRF